MGKLIFSIIICLGFLIPGFSANKKSEQNKTIKPQRVSAESAPEWAKNSKWIFKVDAGEYICYFDGATFLLGVTTKDGKRVLGKSCIWLMQYRIDGKFHNHQEYNGIPQLKIYKSKKETSIVLPVRKGKLLEWGRKIVFQGKKITFEYEFRYTDMFKEQASKADHISIFTRVGLPGYKQEKASPAEAVFQGEGFAWEISFDPFSKRDKKGWNFNPKSGELNIDVENASALRKDLNETFMIRFELQPI